MTNIQQINWFTTAGTLRAAFELNTREDGTQYWAFTAEARQSVDNLSTVVRELHDEELPNDWRYDTIVSILDALMEISGEDIEWYDEASEIANNLTEINTSALHQWYADNASRSTYHDDAVAEGLIAESATMHQRLAMGQFKCIEGMVHQLIDVLKLV